MPPKRKSTKRKPTKKSRKPKSKSTFRNKKLKKALPKIPRLSAQERAQGLSRIQKGEYTEGIHQPYVRSGKEIVINPAYLNSAAYLSGGIPVNLEVDVDHMMDTSGDYRPGYFPEPDAKRQTAESAARYNKMLDEQERKRVTTEPQVQALLEDDDEGDDNFARPGRLMDVANQMRFESIDRRNALQALTTVTVDRLRAAMTDMQREEQQRRGLHDEAEDLGHAELDATIGHMDAALERESDTIQELADMNNIDHDDIGL